MTTSRVSGPVRLPEKPTGLRGVIVAVGNLIDYCRQITPQNTPDATHELTLYGVHTRIHQLPWLNTDIPQSHFHLEQSGGTTIKVHGGSFNRQAGKPGQFVGHLGLATAGEEYDGTLTLSGITTTCYVRLKLNDAFDPTACTCDAVATVTTLDTKGLYRIIGKITCTNNTIASVEDYETQDIKDFYIEPDTEDGGANKSLGFTADFKRLQAKGFDSEGNSNPGLSVADGVLVRIGTPPNGHLHYVPWATIEAYLGLAAGGTPEVFKLTGMGTLTLNISAGRWGEIEIPAQSCAWPNHALTYYVWLYLTTIQESIPAGSPSSYWHIGVSTFAPYASGVVAQKLLGVVTSALVSGTYQISSILHYNYGEVQTVEPNSANVNQILTCVNNSGGYHWEAKAAPTGLPTPTTAYKVCTVSTGIAWIEDWTRAHA